MTIEEFIDLLSEKINALDACLKTYKSLNQDLFNFNDYSYNFLENKNLKFISRYHEIDSKRKLLIIMKELIEKGEFQNLFFESLLFVFEYLTIPKEKRLSLLVSIINKLINNITLEKLKYGLYDENRIVKKYPDYAKERDWIYRSDEEINKLVKDQFESINKIRKFINEDENLNLISPSENLDLSFAFYLGIPESLVDLIINECNRLFVINENAKEKANPQKIMKANITPNKNQKSISLEEKQKAYRKYIKYINPDDNYSVRYKEFIDDNLIKELENLINILDISNLNQQTIWKNIKNHNNEIINNQLNETFVETMSVLFPEVYKEIYNLTISLINNETLKQHHTYKYLVNEIADYQKGIETLIWQFINGDIDEEECKELIDINFLYLTEKLDELYQYQEINMILIREKKEE